MTWMIEADRSASPEKDLVYNDMHVTGMALCMVLHKTELPDAGKYNLREELGHFASRIALIDVDIKDMTWQQVADVIATLQIEFNTLFETREGGGCTCCVRIQRLVVELLARMGFFLGQTWRPLSDSDPSSEDLHGIVTVDAGKWRSLRADAVVNALDGVHAIATSSWLILSAHGIPKNQHSRPDMHAFVREASLDDFYEISQIADTPVGAISQYKHKFKHLFHSTSQVVFWHYPSYRRRKQLALEQLVADDAEAIALLPLIMQLNPSIPVLYEHTGAGQKSVHAQHKWAWVLVGKIVLLSNQDMRLYHGDPRDLLFYAENV